MKHFLLTALLACVVSGFAGAQSGPSAKTTDPLPSWNDGVSKLAIVSFVMKVTTEGSPHYVKPEERVAVFDHDGTLWSEQPAYFQLLFWPASASGAIQPRGIPEAAAMKFKVPDAAPLSPCDADDPAWPMPNE